MKTISKKTALACLSAALMATAFMPAHAAISKDQLSAVKEGADADYKTARIRCDSLAGTGKDVCLAEADAARTRQVARAEWEYKGTTKALYDGRVKVARADYAVDKAKCGAKAGNDKDVCMKEAKAAEAESLADAKADNKSANAFAAAEDTKRDAYYKVAIEKCDALNGAAKTACVADAKASFGK